MTELTMRLLQQSASSSPDRQVVRPGCCLAFACSHHSGAAQP